MEFNSLYDTNIKLIKESHKYEHLKHKELTFTSVTSFVENFFEKFDSFKIAKKLIKNYKKYSNYTVESLVEKWNETANYGTFVHEELENWLKYQIIPKEKKSINGMNWLKSYMINSDYELFPEKIVYSKELEIAGTIDILALDKKTNKYDLIDWKTSKKIEMNSYGGKVGTKIATSNIPDCNYYHYALQLSLYRYLLERYYGLKIRTMIIAHLKEDYARAIIVPYMIKEIRDMLIQK